MSEIRDKVDSELGRILSELRETLRIEHYDFHYDAKLKAQEEILSTPELAIVDRDAELPDLDQLIFMGATDEELKAYLVKAGYVKEV